MEQKTSSIVDKNVQPIRNDKPKFGTWTVLIPFLIVALVILKKFIYIPDEKRHGK